MPYPNGDRMVIIWGVQGTQGQNGIVYADYVEWRAQNRTFDDQKNLYLGAGKSYSLGFEYNF